MMMMHSNNNNCNNKNDLVKFKVFLKKEQKEKRPRSKIISLSKQSLSFAHLEAQIVEHFQVKHDQRVIVCYQDEEDDQVTISSDEELLGAISAFANKRAVCLLASLMTNCTSSPGCKAGTSSAAEEERMSSLLNELESRGFANKRRNIRLLKKHNGDIDKVIQTLTEGSSKRQARIMKRKMKGSQNVELPKRKHEDGHHDTQPERKEEEEEEVKDSPIDSCQAICSIPAADYEPLLRELETKGFSNKRMNIRLLKKHNGDINKVTQVLIERSSKHHERIMMKKTRKGIVQDETPKGQCEIANPQPEMSQGASVEEPGPSEMTALEPITSIPVDCQDEDLNLMLKKHSGEVEKVIQVLTQQSTKRQEKIMIMKATEEIYSSMLSDLEAKGFSQKRLNIRLLKKNANDTEKVIQQLTAMCARRQEKRKKRASRFLQGPQQPYEDDEKLKELEAKGFYNKNLNVRMLKRRGHDISKVLQVLSDREARLARKRVKQHKQADFVNQAA